MPLSFLSGGGTRPYSEYVGPKVGLGVSERPLFAGVNVLHWTGWVTAGVFNPKACLFKLQLAISLCTTASDLLLC